MHSSKAPHGKSRRENRVRIIGGEHRGRRIAVPDRPGLRPTPDRVRETLFNWLGQRLDGLACLDLFAGSGALGFEAASRGAARVVMVENDRVAFRALEDARRTIGFGAVELNHGDAFDYLARADGAFDVVFLDPPFRQNALATVLERLPRRLAPRARVYLEAPDALDAGAGWSELRRSRAGQVSYQLLEWKGDDQGGLPGNV
jgi:16S rRNA (guanine966-N2)-methyltransferase